MLCHIKEHQNTDRNAQVVHTEVELENTDAELCGVDWQYNRYLEK